MYLTLVMLVLTLLLHYVCFFFVLMITITLPMAIFGTFRIGLNVVFQAVLEEVLDPWIASQLHGNNDFILERIIAERRRLGRERPMPGQYPPEEEIDEPEQQQRARRPYRIFFMEKEMVRANMIAKYRGWLLDMEQASDPDWVAAQVDDPLQVDEDAQANDPPEVDEDAQVSEDDLVFLIE
ncbi:hypothetical protein EAF04_010595 [Stromatinia cepivora]|nr:hypothetical protein EAF04_010595 [Stromatinia cepivora]